MELNACMFVHNNVFTHMWLEHSIVKLLKENEKKTHKQICYGCVAYVVVLIDKLHQIQYMMWLFVHVHYH